MTETGAPARGAGGITWETFAGERVIVHAPQGSNVIKSAPAELMAAESTVLALEDLLQPPEKGGPPIDVYLVDAVAGSFTGASGGVGGGGIVRTVLPDGPWSHVAKSLTPLVVERWFGSAAATAGPIVDGIAGLAAERSGSGPPVQEATDRVKTGSEQGRPVTVLDLFGEDTDKLGPAVREDVATSFVGFLDGIGEQGALGRFLAAFDPSKMDDAFAAVYKQPLAKLEERWLLDISGEIAGAGKGAGSSFRFLLPLMKPYRAKYIVVLVLMAISVVISIMLPLVSGCAVGALSRIGQPGAPEPGGFCGVVAPELTTGRVLTIVFVLLFVYIVDAGLSLRRTYLQETVFKSIGKDLREKMFRHLQRLPHRFYGKARVGDVTARMTGDLDSLEDSMVQVFGQGVFMAMTAAIAAVTAFLQNPLIGALVLIIVPAFVAAHRVLGSRIGSAAFETQELAGEANAVAQENLSAHAVVKAYGLEERSIKTYGGRLADSLRASLRLSLIGQLFEGTIGLSVSIAQLLVLGAGSILVINGNIDDPGKMVTLLLLLPAVFVPMGLLADVGQSLQMAAGSIQRVNEIVEEPIEIENKPDARTLPPVEKEIKVDNVNFSYDEDRPILHDVDLVIPAGKNVALVGPSGSGKSTIVNLLMRFWDPNEGCVQMDGQDLRDVSLESLRGQIGIVFQDTFIFNSSIRDNIGIGRLDATDEEIEAAAGAAQLDSFIQAQPQGFETVLGERGSRMSGGQRQRLAIARAILRDPRILILDEATSALDARTEAEILDTLKDLVKGRTTISITHRLIIAAMADLIYVFDQGKLIEEGPHEELVRSGGLYQQLYEEQTGTSTRGRVTAGLQAQRLHNVPLFLGLPPETMTRVAEQLVLERYGEGEDIVVQGDPGEAFFMVARGIADIYVDDGRVEKRVNTLQDGDYFGEFALLTEGPRTATVRAVTPIEVFSLSREDFRRLLEQEPSLHAIRDRFLADRENQFAAAATAAGLSIEKNERDLDFDANADKA
jgi:ABC-type multidrug transport system fused ATPase/permease subunit